MLSLLVSCALTYVLIFALREGAERLALIEHPGEHRAHTVATPVIGGLAMCFGMAGGWLLVHPQALAGLLLGAIVIVAVGVWDDRHRTSHWVRFAGQIGAAGIMIGLGGVALFDLGYLTTTEYFFYLGSWSVPLTMFATVGVINAMNMSDGMDGLAGSLSLVSFASLLVIAIAAADRVLVASLLVAIAAVVTFLCFNARIFGRRRASVFMGDGGSMLLGFVLAWFFISMSQGGEARTMAPVTALWLFALPLWDAVGVMCRRLARGKSPFQADREHYHHYLQAMGLTVNQTLGVVIGTAAFLAGLGLLSWYTHISEEFMFYAFLALFACFVGLMEVLDRRSRAFRTRVVGESP